MTQTRLENLYLELHNDLRKGKSLNDMSDEELTILVTYETWSDGADWEEVAELMDYYQGHRNQSLDQLKEVYGYAEEASH